MAHHHQRRRQQPVHRLVTRVLLVHLLMRVALAGDGRRRVLHLPGDLLLGGLFPMHEQVRIPGHLVLRL